MLQELVRSYGLVVGVFLVTVVVIALLMRSPRPGKGQNVSPQQFERQFLATAIIAALAVMLGIVLMSLWLAGRL